jgi:uncharacterized membrane protein HdeD (DUF308 family)
MAMVYMMRPSAVVPFVLGCIALLVGLFMVLFPNSALKILVILVGALALCIGILLCIMSLVLSRAGGLAGLVLLVPGVAALALAIFCFLDPVTAGSSLTMVLGAVILFGGLGVVFSGVSRKGLWAQRALLGAGGVVIAVLGLILMIYPGISSLTLVTILGILLLIVGFIGLLTSVLFLLRGRGDQSPKWDTIERI